MSPPNIQAALDQVRRTCSCCQREISGVPASARYGGDEELEGWYWECSCHSTQFVSLLRIQAAAQEAA
jgi:hypothetical protein